MSFNELGRTLPINALTINPRIDEEKLYLMQPTIGRPPSEWLWLIIRWETKP